MRLSSGRDAVLDLLCLGGGGGNRRLFRLLGLAQARQIGAVGGAGGGRAGVVRVFLTRIDAVFAGRAYAAYGGVYIAASLLWIWADLGGVSGLTVGRLAGPNLAGAKMPSATTEWFTPLWLAGLLVPGASRLIQLAGLVSGLRQRDTRGPIMFMFVVALYFLVVNGPIGYARYRLPMEPTLIVLFVAGLAALGLLDRIQEVTVNQLRHSGKQPEPGSKES